MTPRTADPMGGREPGFAIASARTGSYLSSVSTQDRRTSVIVVLTVRPWHSDFRLPLARELARLGREVYYVFLKRRPETFRISPDGETLDPVATGWPGLWALATRLRRARPLVLNSTNLAFPLVSLGLGFLFGGTRCLDLHDDLRYGKVGLGYAKADLAQRLLVASSDLTVHAAPTLAELFPRSHHLGNASEVEPGSRGMADPGRVLVLASLDARIDLGLLDAVAAASPTRLFEIHGRVMGEDPATRAALDGLTARRPNVRHHGAYRAVDLTTVLAPYSVTFAPYLVGSRLTRYLDPLRYYHCLRAGLELVTTDIPAARDLAAHLHIASTAADVVAALDRLASTPSGRRNAAPPAGQFGWAERAKDFLTIVDEHSV